MDHFDDDEFGGPLFDADGSDSVEAPAFGERSEGEGSEEGLSFGDDATGPLPHWTEPPTGQVPNIESTASEGESTDDLDVWSSFTSESPVWKEGDSVDSPSGNVAVGEEEPVPDTTGELSWEDAPADTESSDEAEPTELPTTDEGEVVSAAPREPARITIGTDPSGMPRRPEPTRRGGPQQRPPSAGSQTPGTDRRNLPLAVFTGLLLAALFIALTMWRPVGALLFITVALGIAAIEYFGKVTEKGYRPAVAAGVAGIVAAPLAAYWVGNVGLPLVIAFAFMAGALSFMGANSIESGPMPNMAITSLGLVWIGLMGSYAALMLEFGNAVGLSRLGTDTLMLTAVGVVANDVGAYFVGTAFGRTPLRAWISPGKSLEGFLGGTVLTLIVMVIVGLQELSDTWSSMSHLLMLGITISIMAPLGDLTESMFKRNLDVKDFGTIVRGHGGVLDRFDGFLFTLPMVYYLFLVVEPWTEFSG
jgi:phosphatidate cytidylyltransferase